MKRANKLTLALLSAALLAGAGASSASDGISKDSQAGGCRFIYDENGSAIAYCCGNVCIYAG